MPLISKGTVVQVGLFFRQTLLGNVLPSGKLWLCLSEMVPAYFLRSEQSSIANEANAFLMAVGLLDLGKSPATNCNLLYYVSLSGCPVVRLSGCPVVRLSGCPVVLPLRMCRDNSAEAIPGTAQE